MINREMMVIAHRGASAYAPENTLAAFAMAMEMGVPHLELDVHLTSDGQVVVIHDRTLDRTTNGSGPVSDQTLDALRNLDAGSWFGAQFAGERIPSLDQTLDACKGRAKLHVEIKGSSPSLVPRTLECIRNHDMTDEVTITSFDAARIREVHDENRGWMTSWLMRDLDDGTVAAARALGVRILCPAAAALHPEWIDRLHEAGFLVRAWGVKTEAIMRRLVEWGVDGMTVDFPDRLIACLREHPSRRDL